MRWLGLVGACLFIVGSNCARASTSDYVQIDSLGYQCVQEDDLEDFWIVGGSGKDPMRAPPICIVDPCAATEDQDAFGLLYGREVSTGEYIDYRRRLNGVCGTPTYWEDRGLTEDEVIRAIFNGSRVDSWETLTASVPLSPALLFHAASITFLVIIRKKRQPI